MGIGRLRCHVVDVDNLAAAEAFWSELTGLPVIPSGFPGRYSYLGQADPWRHEVILHLVKTRKGPEANRSHVDIWVSDIDTAIGRIEAIGGSLKRAPTIYPRPGSHPGEPPCIDWAVMQDPFGNEFCLITVLSAEEVSAIEEDFAQRGPDDDEHWRALAGRHASTARH
jgi:predicted enzyme related to lactoylglutathione lyase